MIESRTCCASSADSLNTVLPLLQVVRSALENATSVAKTFLTSDVVVTTIPEPEPAGAGAGMDAMGGY